MFTFFIDTNNLKREHYFLKIKKLTMNVKELKEYLNRFNDEDEVICVAFIDNEFYNCYIDSGNETDTPELDCREVTQYS